MTSISAAATITPPGNFFPYAGSGSGAAGNGVVAVSAPGATAWTAVSNASWLNIVTGASGAGNGSVTFSVAANSGAQRVGTLTIAGQPFTVTQLGPPPATGSVPVIEYHNSAQDDYFITADPTEQQTLDAAAQAGAVWSRTGMTFNSGGTASVYRFIYKSPTGVNTHFYTVNTNEQSELLANFPIWALESPVAFYMTAAPSQSCPAGTLPVYRAAQEQTGSHRFTTIQSAINEVLARGWTNEGVAFCAPASTAAPPAVYADLYTQLSGDLDDFQSAIAAAATGPRHSISFAAQLTAANSNNGPALLNASSMTLIQQELDFLKTLGVQAVSVEVSFPMLNATFLGSSYSQWVTFYGNVAAAARARGLQVIVESQSMIPSGLQSSAWGTQLQTFYPTMNFNQYVAARASTAAAVASTMRPDYFVLQEEPDTESVQSGQSSVATASGATTMLNASIAAVAGLVPGMKVGAGFGPWLGAYQQFANAYTRTGCSASQPCVSTPLDFLDLHLYPVIEHAAGCSRTAPCPPGTENFWRNAMSVAATANVAGMHMTVSQAWLRKVRDSEWPPLGGAGDVQEAREAYDFWAPLDQRFLQTLHDLATYQGMYWIAPFNTPNFSAYLQWSSANSISGDCGSGPSPCGSLTPTQVYASVQSAAIAALPSGSYTSTGQFWHDLIASDSIVRVSSPALSMH
jgi:hypothetical protein